MCGNKMLAIFFFHLFAAAAAIPPLLQPTLITPTHFTLLRTSGKSSLFSVVLPAINSSSGPTPAYPSAPYLVIQLFSPPHCISYLILFFLLTSF